jgi:hypothetical protein
MSIPRNDFATHGPSELDDPDMAAELLRAHREEGRYVPSPKEQAHLDRLEREDAEFVARMLRGGVI